MYSHNIAEMVVALRKAKLIRKQDESAAEKALLKVWDDKIAIVWNTEDVIGTASNMGLKKHITKGEAQAVLDFVLDKHDATVGVSWDTIEYAINEICGTEP